MARTIMILGTMSNVGKSLLTAGLCRIFRQDGYRVAPFKAQNMALNSFITRDGLEMGRAQVMQAEAAGVEPDVRMNPVLLKPTSDQGSQVILNGEVVGNLSAREYYDYKSEVLPSVQRAFSSLSEEYDVLVLEGAGSPAEINLKEQDIVNMNMAKMAMAPVLLVGDIDRGGVFASLSGTLDWLDETERGYIRGVIINKFRGDASLLAPGLGMLEERIGIPVLGVVPWMHLQLDDEDSLSSRLDVRAADGVVDVAVIRLPHISNFTDFDPLERIEGVGLRYVSSLSDLGRPDLILLPGTKNTLADLTWLRETGLERMILRLVESGSLLMGICGGFQMLGNSLKDPLNVEQGGEMQGMGLLDMDTVFGQDKTRTRVQGVLPQVAGAFSCLSGCSYEGYEIHMGKSGRQETLLASQNVCGTYVHGIFDRASVTGPLREMLLGRRGLEPGTTVIEDASSMKERQYDLLAEHLRQCLNMEEIYRILEEGVPEF